MRIVHTFSRIHTGNVEQVFYLVENAVPDEEVLHESATVGVGLYEDAAFAVSCIVAVLYKDVAHSCRHLAAYDYGVQTLEVTVADDDVLRRCRRRPSVVVPAALYGNIVVAVVEVYVR